jgi:hypothetical protein
MTLFDFLFMKTIYVAQMKWCEREEPICAGTNKKKLVAEALRILHAERGKGPVGRGMAMCSEPIRADDIEVVEIPLLSNVPRQESPLGSGGNQSK